MTLGIDPPLAHSVRELSVFWRCRRCSWEGSGNELSCTDASYVDDEGQVHRPHLLVCPDCFAPVDRDSRVPAVRS